MGKALRVLVVDDERISRETTTQQLRESGYYATAAENSFRALQHLEDTLYDVVLTDLRMPGMNGLEFLNEIGKKFAGVDVILMTAYGTIETAVAAMQEGATDFLTKPFSFRELELRLKKLESLRDTRRQLQALRTALDQSQACWGLVGKSAAMRGIYELVELFSNNTAPILITGETGTGKELVGRALHQNGQRQKEPFVAVACGAIPHDVAESEIFGHERGAFTGAISRRKGSFERAHKGTLLLDDVDDLHPEIQVKLMRILQEGTLQRVGGEEEIRVDVRFIATSKVDLFQAVEEGRFRKDLFYRLRGLEIKLPPLRDRGEDLLLLAQHFLRMLAADEDSQPKALSAAAGDCLRRHPWPGNVRELKRALESAVAVCSDEEIHPIHLPDYLRENKSGTNPFTLHLADTNGVQFNELVHQFEDEIISWAMGVSGGQQQKAAEILGLPRTTLQSKLSRNRNS